MTAKRTEYQNKYDAKNTVQFKLKYNKRTDAEIIEFLRSQPNKQGYIRELIKRDKNFPKYVDTTKQE